MKLIVTITADSVSESVAEELYNQIKNSLKDQKHVHVNGIVMDKYKGSHPDGPPAEVNEI